jgi:hypothetical protein
LSATILRPDRALIRALLAGNWPAPSRCPGMSPATAKLWLSWLAAEMGV